VSQFIRGNGNFENWDMIQIQVYPCNTKRELLAQERLWIEQLKSTLNVNKPLRTKEDLRVLSQNHRASHKIEMSVYNKKREQSEKRVEYRAQYRAAHKDKIIASGKSYYQQNKEQFLARNRKNRKLKKIRQEIIEMIEIHNQFKKDDTRMKEEFIEVCAKIDHALEYQYPVSSS
jgi:hypothetical protein